MRVRGIGSSRHQGSINFRICIRDREAVGKYVGISPSSEFTQEWSPDQQPPKLLKMMLLVEIFSEVSDEHQDEDTIFTCRIRLAIFFPCPRKQRMEEGWRKGARMLFQCPLQALVC